MSDIAEILKDVPEIKLNIIPLTWELIDEDGHIDAQKSSFRVMEVADALQEAEAYADSVERAVSRLKNLTK